ncbi:UPF0280 family protein [Pseudoxanthobacter sp. M-2]|uniref:UPF0280 family protein n=1 Tax=Pseudoxanthobacter sp. M-2 TaxID=3078754 RepID=UPI0038FC2B63
MTRAHAAMLPDGRRLHLQDGPIDLVIEAFGSPAAVQAAYAAAMRRFDGLLDELCSELPLLRAPARGEGKVLTGPVARRMYEAVAEHAEGGGQPSGLRHSGVLPSADPPSVVIPGLVPGTHSSPRSPTLHLPGRCMGSRHKAGNDFGEGGALPHTAPFITPMAAVAGSVADEILAAMLAGASAAEGASGREHSPLVDHPLSRAYVNNGGDIALHLAPGERFRIGLVDRPDRPSLDASSLFARTELSAADGVGGIATSGWRGRSFSLGIADAVTVLAATAASADAAATVIANAVNLPGHPAIVRVPARDLAPDSDLGDRPVTRGVGPLTAQEIDEALTAGVAVAEDLCRRGLIAGAALHLAGATRIVGIRFAGEIEAAGIASPRAGVGTRGDGRDHDAADAVSSI